MNKTFTRTLQSLLHLCTRGQLTPTQIPKSSRGVGGGAFLLKMRPLPAPVGSRQSTRPMFSVFQARTAAFDESASPVSNNFRGSTLEVCWRDHSTPIHRLIVCTAGPPIPARGAPRAAASICPTSAPFPPGLPGASPQLPRDPQPAVTSTTTCMLQSFAVEGRATPALLYHAQVAKKLSAGSAKPQRTLKWRRRSFANVDPRRRLPIESIAFAWIGLCVCNQSQLGSDTFVPTLENANIILATQRGSDMRKPRRACDQTFAPRGINQGKHALPTTARSEGETRQRCAQG